MTRVHILRPIPDTQTRMEPLPPRCSNLLDQPIKLNLIRDISSKVSNQRSTRALSTDITLRNNRMTWEISIHYERSALDVKSLTSGSSLWTCSRLLRTFPTFHETVGAHRHLDYVSHTEACPDLESEVLQVFTIFTAEVPNSEVRQRTPIYLQQVPRVATLSCRACPGFRKHLFYGHHERSPSNILRSLNSIGVRLPCGPETIVKVHT